MRRYIDMTGARIGTLCVVGIADDVRGKAAIWKFLCEKCGATGNIEGRQLRRGVKNGYWLRGCNNCADRVTRHGHARNGGRSRELRIWAGMMDRCYRERNRSFQYYGGRGIYVADEWHDFSVFLADMGRAPEGMSLDRIDGDGPYSKQNCRWATAKLQNRNSNRNIMVARDGLIMCVAEWAELLGVEYDKLYRWVSNGLNGWRGARRDAEVRNGRPDEP